MPINRVVLDGRTKRHLSLNGSGGIVGKTAVKFNIPEVEAVERLKDLIREHGKWVDAAPQGALWKQFPNAAPFDLRKFDSSSVSAILPASLPGKPLFHG